MARYLDAADPQPGDPSPLDILLECGRIQAGWTAAERAERMLWAMPEGWTVPESSPMADRTPANSADAKI